MEDPLKWTDKQKQIANQMSAILGAMNAIDIKDLEQMVAEVDRETAFDPLLHPERWRGDRFEFASLTKKVVQAIIAFKKEVSGIGRFHKVETHATKD